MSFGNCIHLCKYYFKQGIKHFHHSRKYHHAPSQPVFSSILPSPTSSSSSSRNLPYICPDTQFLLNIFSTYWLSTAIIEREGVAAPYRGVPARPRWAEVLTWGKQVPELTHRSKNAISVCIPEMTGGDGITLAKSIPDPAVRQQDTLLLK